MPIMRFQQNFLSRAVSSAMAPPVSRLAFSITLAAEFLKTSELHWSSSFRLANTTMDVAAFM
ncbi:hypothetical protein A3731_21935 [Roseovarius sp. HI0049]|nr:hypothetical protein A3731_21935 [Roseovarius sp. HI0049]